MSLSLRLLAKIENFFSKFAISGIKKFFAKINKESKIIKMIFLLDLILESNIV